MLEHQLAMTSDHDRVHIGIARGGEPLSHLAQRNAVDERVVIGGDGPAVVSRDRNTAAVSRIRDHCRPPFCLHRQRGEQRHQPAERAPRQHRFVARAGQQNMCTGRDGCFWGRWSLVMGVSTATNPRPE
jgi:hypothetical protein